VNKIQSTRLLIKKRYLKLQLLIFIIFTSELAFSDQTINEASFQAIPQTVVSSLKKNQIPPEALSISITEIPTELDQLHNTKNILEWRSNIAMNPASTMKLVTTIASLDILGPQYQWTTNIYTDGVIENSTLIGNIYFQGDGDPRLTSDELNKLMLSLKAIGIEKIDGNLIFDRSAYSPKDMEHITIDGETTRSYNLPPDPLLYSFRTLSFELIKNSSSNSVDITLDPPLALFKIDNKLKLIDGQCDEWREKLQFRILSPKNNLDNNNQLTAQFLGTFAKSCPDIDFNIVNLDPNTFLTKGIAAAWERNGGIWGKSPTGVDGSVPTRATLLLSFKGSHLSDVVMDVNKHSNNVMARQLLLTLSLNQKGKPATTDNGEIVVNEWLTSKGLNFNDLNLENGSGLSRTETISTRNLTDLLITARHLSISNDFFKSLPVAGTDGTMKDRLVPYFKKYESLSVPPQARIKTGSLTQVRAISGYVISKSGKMYAASSFINHPNSSRGREAHDQLLIWLLEDGPATKQIKVHPSQK